MIKIKDIAKLLVISVSGAVICGCSSGGSSGASANMVQSLPSTASDPSIAAFQNGFYSFAIKQGCNECHSSTGSYQHTSPFFADSDLTTAYKAAKGNEIGTAIPLINFSSPSTSFLATHVGDSHCPLMPCQDPAGVPTAVAGLQTWAAAELIEYPSAAVATGPAFQTSAQPVPMNLPLTTSSAPAVMRFSLAGIIGGDPSLSGAILEISIELYDTGGNEYRIFNPRIVGSTNTVNINGIHVYVRPSSGSGIGIEDTLQGNYWDSLALSAAASAAPSPLPAGPIATAPAITDVVLGVAVQSTADVITLGFNSLH